MKTSTVDVGGILSSLSDIAIEKQLRRIPGVERADVDYATARATVTYDARDEPHGDQGADRGVRLPIHPAGPRVRHACESMPVGKKQGDTVVGAIINKSGSF